MLDGCFEKWKKEGYSIDVKSNPLKNSRFRGKPNSKVLADANEVKRSLGNKNVIIVDARTKEEYDGTEVRGARRGHIPKAVNIDWAMNIGNDTIKSKHKLAKIYSKIPKTAQIITYCQGGYRAANAFLVLKMLGYKRVKMYLGSWGEWGNRLDLPVEQHNSNDKRKSNFSK